MSGKDFIDPPRGTVPTDGMATALTTSLIGVTVATAVAGLLVDRFRRHRGGAGQGDDVVSLGARPADQVLTDEAAASGEKDAHGPLLVMGCGDR